MSVAVVPITYVTPAIVKAAGTAGIRSISAVPGFDWVGMIRGSQLTDELLAEICNLVNGSTGATPPATTTAPAA